MIPDLAVIIPGKPRTQGSMSLFRAADGHEVAKYAQTTVGHRNLAIGIIAQRWGRPPIAEAVAVRIGFYYARPASHFGTGRNAGIVKPSAPYWPASKRDDIDKASRLILDALVIAGALVDDGMVTVLRAEKRWTEPGNAGYTHVEVFDLTREMG